MPTPYRARRSTARGIAALATIALVTIALAGCQGGEAGPPAGSGGRPTPDPQALTVVTTTTVFADIVRNVGGNHVVANSIVPPGVGPEDYEPRPDDARLLADADLVVSNGVGLDNFLDDLLASGSGGQTSHLVLGDGIPVLTVDGEPNPHFWLDPTLVKGYYLSAIARRLTEIDPAAGPEYAANAAAYGAELETLDRDLASDVETVPESKRKLVTFHDAFPYFARHYGFELVGVILPNVGQEPTAGALADLVETVRATGVEAVFSEAQFNPRLARTLADEAGVRTVVSDLYNDALGPAPADTYIGLMRWNVERIVAALR